MTYENKKIYIGAIGNKENQKNVDVFYNVKCAKLHFSPMSGKHGQKKQSMTSTSG